MKQKNLTGTLTAALLTLVTAAAYGQTNSMTADIPFAFHAVGSSLPAGRYQIAPATIGSEVMIVRNVDTGKAVYAPSKDPITESVRGSALGSKDANPRLVFQCRGEEDCSLAQLWSGGGRGLEFRTPVPAAGQRQRDTVYVIRLKVK
jgi:hypothetical protein